MYLIGYSCFRMQPIYEIEEYVTTNGKSPFSQWLLKLKDKRAQAKIQARLTRATFGNFGDWKNIKGAKGICEMREHYGPGYRIFYSVVENKIILLLVGAEKSDQEKAIEQAQSRLDDYTKRRSDS